MRQIAPRRTRVRPRVTVLLAWALAGGACAGKEAVRLTDLVPVPEPVVERMEVAVQEQLASRRRDLDALLSSEDPDRGALAQAFGELGRLYHAYDLTQAARPCYENAHGLAPEEFRWSYYLGVLEQSEGEIEAAARHFEACLKTRPADLPTLLRLGDVRLEQNRPDLARHAFATAVDAHPGQAAGHYGLGRVALAQDRPQEAVAHFERVLALQPQATGVHYSLALAYRRLGELEQARSHMKRQGPSQDQPQGAQVRVEDPLLAELVRLARSVGLYLQRGGQALRRGDAATAVRELRRAVEVDPQSAPAHQSLASALALGGQVDEAVEHYRRALELDPQNATVAYNLGNLLRRRGKPRQAEAHLSRAVELDPSLVEARLTLAAVREEEGRYVEARDEYAAVLDVDPGNVTARARLAMLPVYSGEADGAPQAVETLLALLAEAPFHPDVHLNLGSALVQAGRRVEAREHFIRVLDLEASRTEKALAHLNLAAIVEGQGAVAEARDHYRSALELHPGLNRARFALARLLGNEGQFDEAARHFAEVLRLEPHHGAARLGQATALVLARRYREARRRLEEGLELLPQDGTLAHSLARLLATCPDPQVRDGAQALKLAFDVFESQQSLTHAETVAMALAEVGRFDEAIRWQEAVLRDATQAGETTLARRARENLERYRRHEPYRDQGPR